MAMANALEGLATPAVIVDRDRLVRNIARIQEKGERHGVHVRPHIKTHKCIEIARLQVAAGAIGITASKPAEALVFIEAGIESVTVAYPIVDRRRAVTLLEAAAVHGCRLRTIADSDAVVSTLAAGAREVGTRLDVFLKIDVGLGRVGVKPDSPDVIRLAGTIAEAGALRFAGLLAHAGHAYGARDPQAVRAIAESERLTLLGVAERLRAAGLEVPEISVGSTPTVLAAECFDGITEIRPGNYVFLDLTAVRQGLARLDDVALSVLATVVSVNQSHAIIDAGSKVLSSDLGAHSTQGVIGYGRAFTLDQPLTHEHCDAGLVVERLSEEHGFVALQGHRLSVGDRLRIVPNHSCPVVNLSHTLQVIDCQHPLETWPVAARALVQ
ncbi:MAG TPA: alanine racemase [Candidatus Competibacteraceae bacterium]|nr:alanine racemase [Candidatus Competibacteraceae bacterium]